MSEGVIFSTQSAAKFEISKSLMPCSLSLCWVEMESAAAAVVRRGIGNNIELCLHMSLSLSAG